MVKKLTSVGNSKAVILPSEMIKKYKLDEGKVLIEETGEGILIRSVRQDSNFQKTVDTLRKKKIALYKKIASQANEPDTVRYYSKAANNFSDVDPGLVEE